MTEPANTLTKIGNDFTFQVGIGGTSLDDATYHDFCAVFDAGTIGETKPLIDVTSLCDQARTYRSGLSDGASFTLKCNFLDGDYLEQEMYSAFKSHLVQAYRLKLDGISPEEHFEFNATITAWQVLVPVGAKAELNFTLKVTGPVTWVYNVVSSGGG
jgi:hypothetical protein